MQKTTDNLKKLVVKLPKKIKPCVLLNPVSKIFFVVLFYQIKNTKQECKIMSEINSNIQFTGFVKIKGSAHKLNPVANSIRETLPESFVFYGDKSKYKRTLYILTGKHQDRFVSCMKKKNNSFMDLKQNVEKYIGKTAKTLKRKNVEKKLKNGSFYV